LTLLSLAIAPIFICAFYFYIRDKYEKEPINLLTVGLFFGVVITFPIVFMGNVLMLFLPSGASLAFEAFYIAFVISSFTEEFFKYIVLFFLTWRNKNFNEKFDGIVYAVFVSLGFAFLENILYVFSDELGGTSTAINRAIFSVPGHALFGAHMGYYFGLAKFDGHKYLVVAFLSPWLIHAIYNYILLSDIPFTLPIFTIFAACLWVSGLKKMDRLVKASPFKPEKKITNYH